jgi:glycosyltransferase involved in cell wall biosynthesis
VPEPGQALTVCLILEGSYPFVTGGVSAWVQELILGLPDVRFALHTISPKKDQTVRYPIPPNVGAHTDVVISDHPHSRTRPRGGAGALVGPIRDLHASLAAGSVPDLAPLFDRMPPGYFPSEDAVKSDALWNMLIAANQRHNPVYAFSDYFWSWWSSHAMAFQTVGTELPEVDVYHAISTGYAGLAGVAAKLRTGKALLLTEHGLYHKERAMEIKRAQFVRGYQRDMWISMFDNLSRICYRAADVVISLFEYNRRRQIELGVDADKAIVIPNGIDIPRFSAVVRARREGFHVGLVGRVVPIKDIKTFILMAKAAADALPDAHFWCIGPTDEDPAYYQECQAIVESFRLAERFTFTGKMDVRQAYAYLDVLVLTSIREAQPLVILEAYAAGVPVVSTSVGNVPELLDYDERFLAASKDAPKLARAVRYVHDHPAEIQELVVKNRQKVIRFYDKAEVFSRYAELYARLAGRSG